MKQSLRQLAFVSLVMAMVAGCADQAQQPSETTPQYKGTHGHPGRTGLGSDGVHAAGVSGHTAGRTTGHRRGCFRNSSHRATPVAARP